MLYTEYPFRERFGRARDDGFERVEFQLPYELPAEDIGAELARTGQRVVMFNLPSGDWAKGDRGIAADPDRVQEFRDGVGTALRYAEALDCRMMACLAGRRRTDLDESVQWQTLLENVAHAATALAARGATLLLEPVNLFDVHGFMLPRTEDLDRVIDEVACDNVGIQFDVYHVQRMQGDVTTRLRTLLPRIGHIQIADSPGRHQPGTGELNLDYILNELDGLGYDGVVGLEYVPDPDTATALQWLAGRALD